MNLKKEFKRLEDSRRVQDMKSGGAGSLRSSIFNRTDEAITDEIVKEFESKFDYEWGIDGGEWEKNPKKQVMQFFIQIPKEVELGQVKALLADVNYNKENQTFEALYRPKDGKWGQAKKRNSTIRRK